jgi:hypothetical protein
LASRVYAVVNGYDRLYEFTEMMLVLHSLREGTLFLDVGVNVGTYNVLASNAPVPSPSSPICERRCGLRRNVEINRIESLVTVHEVALGSAEGKVYLSASGSIRSTKRRSKAGRTCGWSSRNGSIWWSGKGVG